MRINKFGDNDISNNGFGNNGGSATSYELAQSDNNIMKMMYDLFYQYTTSRSTELTVVAMMKILNENNCTIRGRGQNRIGFTLPTDPSVVYKVAFRKIGFDDNKRERFISDIIFTDATIANAIGDHFARVYPFACNITLANGVDLSVAMYNFCIAMELASDISSGDNNGSSKYADAINIMALPENRIAYINMCDAVSNYFHIFDLHPVKSVDNLGIKYNANGVASLCIRDYGYFVPRVGSMSDLTNSHGSGVFVYQPIPEQIASQVPSLYIKTAGNSVENYVLIDKDGQAMIGNDGKEIVYPADTLYNDLSDIVIQYIDERADRMMGSYNRF